MKGRGTVIALVVLAAASLWSVWRDSTLANLVRYAAIAYILIPLALRARAGYVRRLPHWTPQSWRRFLGICAMFGASLLICVGMAAAIDFRWPITGAAYSTARAIWVGLMVCFMLIGAWGLASAVMWLNEGDPSAQFTKFEKQART